MALASEEGPVEEEMPAVHHGGISASNGPPYGSRVVSDEDQMMKSPLGVINPLVDNTSWEDNLKSKLFVQGIWNEKGSTLPELNECHPKTKEDLRNFEHLLVKEGINLNGQDTLGTGLLKCFLRQLSEKLHNKDHMPRHIYNRMIWLIDRKSIGQFAVILKAFVLAASVCQRGQYGVTKAESRDKTIPQCSLQGLLASSIDLDWVDGITDTEMGFNRDFGLFKELLWKNALVLEDHKESDKCTGNISSDRALFYHFLSSIAKAGLDNKMHFKVYRRMMIVICRTSSWPNELDVLKAFFMSMCKYQRGDYDKGSKMEDELEGSETEEINNKTGREEEEDSLGIVAV